MLKLVIKNAFGRAQRRPWFWGSAVGGVNLTTRDQADSTVAGSHFIRTDAQGLPDWKAQLSADAGERVPERTEGKTSQYAFRRSTDGGNGGWIKIQVDCISVSPGSDRPGMLGM